MSDEQPLWLPKVPLGKRDLPRKPPRIAKGYREAGPGAIVLDDGGGAGTALNGNGGDLSLSAGSGGIIALKSGSPGRTAETRQTGCRFLQRAFPFFSPAPALGRLAAAVGRRLFCRQPLRPKRPFCEYDDRRRVWRRQAARWRLRRDAIRALSALERRKLAPCPLSAANLAPCPPYSGAN